MAISINPASESKLIQVEPSNRLVALARTIEARCPEAEAALKDSAIEWNRFGATCLGQALYRHHSLFQKGSDAPVWSHLELSYFHNIVPAHTILELVVNPQPAGVDLLRAEILLTTPSSFIVPRGWHGSTDRSERLASLEYIQVQPKYLDKYRDVMRDFCGPAASRLVRTNKFGTFRAMETAAVLYQAARLKIEWNQIHLCELDADNFEGFGKEFKAALGSDSLDSAALSDAFAGLDQMRTLPRWTLNKPVVEADAALGWQFFR